MKIKRNMRALLFIFVFMFFGLVVYLGYSTLTYGEKWFETPYNPRIQEERTNVVPGSVLDRTGEKLVWTENDVTNYSGDKEKRLAVSHVTGDSYGMTTGAQSTFAKYLYGFDTGALDRLSEAFSGEKRHGSDVTLTIDADLSEYIYRQLGDSDGAVVVMNYQTGEILACVSKPAFDPANMERFLEGEGTSELVNRVFSGLYPPGSIFKTVTAAGAINYLKDIGGLTYECTGSIKIGSGEISCIGGKVHGDMDLSSAYAASCNTYFANLTVTLGSADLSSQAKKYGFNKEFLFDDMVVKQSEYTATGDVFDLAWSGIGQYKDLITPIHAALITGAVANGGVMAEPRLLLRVETAEGRVSYTLTPNNYERIESAETSALLKAMMIKTVQDGTGYNAKIAGVTVGGKTGTAEYEEDGEKKAHAWFTGFIDSEKHPLCLAVLVEAGGSGAKTAAPVAKKAFEKAMELGY